MSRTLNPGEKNTQLVYEYDRGSPYEEELRLTAALSALIPDDETRHPDHRFFQVVHLITEYSWAQIHYELRRSVEHLENGRYVAALRLMDRCTSLNEISVRAVESLKDFLPQHSLLTMRNELPPDATGLDSPGHRNLRRVAKYVWKVFEEAMRREQVSLRALLEMQNDSTPAAEKDPSGVVHTMAALRESMLRLDASVLAWKQSHLRLVWSQLGGHPGLTKQDSQAGSSLPTSLGGRPISVMETRSEMALFPALWQAADELYHEVS
ncbi:MAG: hypothetical protein WCA46_06185 [Actinocatenispora sp.]